MFEKMLLFIQDIVQIVVPFSASVFNFMSYEVVGGHTTFEYLFGSALTIYLTFTIAKYLLD